MIRNKTLSGFEIKIPSIFNKYQVVDFIGCGSFSVAYKVQQIKSHEEYAAKIISMQDMKNQNFKDSITNEINIIKKVDHPNIIKFIESFSIINDENEEFYVIITEFCSNGNLHDYMNIMGYLDDEDIKIINKGLAKAISYLHSIKIAHCDIKLNNILLDENYNPKLCDFNLSKDEYSKDENDECGGTFPYSAPETYEEGPIDFYKADIYSLAITIYEIAESCLPFKEDENGDLITDELSMETENVELKSLLEKCTKLNPLERIDANQILQENYFKNIDIDYHENDNYQDDYCNIDVNYSQKYSKYNNY